MVIFLNNLLLIPVLFLNFKNIMHKIRIIINNFRIYIYNIFLNMIKNIIYIYI
jgi:hypothetical protein